MDSEAPETSLDRTLERAAQGDQEAWRLLVERYARRVFGLVVRQCGDRDLAEEITQATFVRVVSHIDRYHEQGRFEPWLFRIAMNQLRDEMRRRKRQARSMDLEGSRDSDDGQGTPGVMLSNSSGQAPDPLENASQHEQLERLAELVGKLNEADRQVLYLRHTAGLSFAQIAETIHEPLGTVLARGHRALTKLRKMLEEKESPALDKTRNNVGK